MPLYKFYYFMSDDPLDFGMPFVWRAESREEAEKQIKQFKPDAAYTYLGWANNGLITKFEIDLLNKEDK